MEWDIDVQRLSEDKYSQVIPSEAISKVLALLEEDRFQTVLVVDKKKHVVGAVTLDQVLRSKASSTKRTMINLPLLRTPSLDTLTRTYLDKNVDLIPIVDKHERLEHVISVYQLARDILFGLEFELEQLVEETPIETTPSDTFEQALAKVRKGFLDVLPIVQEGRLVGAFHTQNLLPLLQEGESRSRGEKRGEKDRFVGTLEGALEEVEPFVVSAADYLAADELVNRMEQSNSQTLFVVGTNEVFQGVIHLRKMLQLILDETSENITSFPTSVLSAPDENIEGIAAKKVHGLMERHHMFFGEKTEPEGMVRFRKIENQSQRGMFMYETEVRVSFGKGKDNIFAVEASDWGAERSLNKAYNKLARLLSDKRKIAKDHTRDKSSETPS